MGGAWLHMKIWELLSDACLLIKSFHEQIYVKIFLLNVTMVHVTFEETTE